MQHFIVAYINPTMAHPRRVIGADKEHQIAGLWIAGRGADVIEPLEPEDWHNEQEKIRQLMPL